MRVLITRPRDDAAATAARLAAMGAEAVIEPLLDIRFIPGPAPNLRDVQAILITSANGARAFAAATPVRGLPLLAVGDASAAEAKRLGFAAVRSAGGDVATLARLVETTLAPQGGALLQVAANAEAGDLAGRLSAAGFEVRKARLYESCPVKGLSDSLVEGLKSARIDAAVFFSPRTARTFVTLAEAAGVSGDLRSVAAYALSPAVAEELRAADWRAVRVAPRPEQDALLAELDADRAAGCWETVGG